MKGVNVLSHKPNKDFLPSGLSTKLAISPSLTFSSLANLCKVLAIAKG